MNAGDLEALPYAVRVVDLKSARGDRAASRSLADGGAAGEASSAAAREI
jgi:hypothetical protein